MSTLFIRVDSRDRQSDESFDDFICDTLTQKTYTISEIELVSVELPNTIYVFSTIKNNRKITFNEGGSDLEFDIGEGSYSIDELISELKTKIDTSGGFTYTITHNNITNKLKIEATGSFKLLFSKIDSPWEELGFKKTDTGLATSHTGNHCVNIVGPRYVNILLCRIPVDHLIGTCKSNFSIPLYGDSYSISHYKKFSDFTLKIKPLKSFSFESAFRVTIMDHYGNLVGLNGNWSMLIKLTLAL